jgi:hypothetical protein
MRVNYRVCESGERNVCVLCVDDRRKIATTVPCLSPNLIFGFFGVANEEREEFGGLNASQAVPRPCLHRPMSHLRPSMSAGGGSSASDAVSSTAPDRPGSALSPSSDPRLPRSSAPLTPTNSGKSTIRSPGIYSDRFIPSRRGVNLQDSFALLPDSPPPKKRDAPQEGGKDDNLDTYTMLLRSELLGDDPQGARRPDEHAPPQSPQRNLFRYRTQPAPRDENAAFALSPVGSESQRVLCSPRKVPRKISTVPYKVLDAPALQARRPPASAHVGARAHRRGSRPERHASSWLKLSPGPPPRHRMTSTSTWSTGPR